jgi:hypothetical protein
MDPLLSNMNPHHILFGQTSKPIVTVRTYVAPLVKRRNYTSLPRINDFYMILITKTRCFPKQQ